jgi:hypothetical protein
MESATIIIFFARLVHFQGEKGVVKKSTLCTLVIMMKKMDGPLVLQILFRNTIILIITIQGILKILREKTLKNRKILR